MLKFILQLGIILSCLALTGCGRNIPDIGTMLTNLNQSLPNLWRLVTALAYVMGFSFALRALYYMKIYGEARTMMSSQASIKTPATYFFVAGALIFIPTMFQTLMVTSFGYANPLDYTGDSKIGAIFGTGMQAMVHIVQFFGLVAFVRGWLYIARTGAQSAQPGIFGKGLTHIIAGVLAINIIGTYNVLANTLGFTGV